MMQVFQIGAFLLGIPLLVLILYLAVRIISSGYYASKKEFLQWYLEHFSKKAADERRKAERRSELIP